MPRPAARHAHATQLSGWSPACQGKPVCRAGCANVLPPGQGDHNSKDQKVSSSSHSSSDTSWAHHVRWTIPSWRPPEMRRRPHHVSWRWSAGIHHHVRNSFIGAFKELHVVVADIGLWRGRSRAGTGQIFSLPAQHPDWQQLDKTQLDVKDCSRLVERNVLLWVWRGSSNAVWDRHRNKLPQSFHLHSCPLKAGLM
jgi:hypothetical protein